MEFNSQICTTKIQSERLLALGLKKETADCSLNIVTLYGTPIIYSSQDSWVDYSIISDNHFPAWSLHRLLCLTNPYLSINPFGNIEIGGKSFSDIYEGLISTIEYNIKEGYFNKEYLEERV